MGNQWKQWLTFSGLQNCCGWWLQPWNWKMLASWKKSYDQPRQHIKRQRHYFVNKGPSSQFSSVQSLSHVRLIATPWTTAHQASVSITNSRIHTNPCPLSWWCHPTISSSVIPFSSRLLSFPASGSFQMSWLLASGGQSIGASASALPMNIQGWFPLGWTGLTSLLSKGLSRIFSGTIVQKHQFFSAQLSLRSDPHICIWLLEKP